MNMDTRNYLAFHPFFNSPTAHLADLRLPSPFTSSWAEILDADLIRTKAIVCLISCVVILRNMLFKQANRSLLFRSTEFILVFFIVIQALS